MTPDRAELTSRARIVADELAIAFLRLCQVGDTGEVDTSDFHDPPFILSDIRPISAKIEGVTFTSIADPQSTDLSAYYKGREIAIFRLPFAVQARVHLEQFAISGSVQPTIHFLVSRNRNPEQFRPDKLRSAIRERAEELLQMQQAFSP